ncbi:geranylgeranylglyceryl/heptaprenylglyceryl phosphate synthase [bacterium]|nr:geranylgeranylglyceryl/heptaprenylglyceryl phosphate synthase [bacterium]
MVTVLSRIHQGLKRFPALFFLLIDPDRQDTNTLSVIGRMAERAGVDSILIGSSFMMSSNDSNNIRALKEVTSIPLLLFPGSALQLDPAADALLFLSLISGRNPRWLIEEHVQAAPLIKKYALESIPTAYLLIESGAFTAVNFISNTLPMPADKPDLVVAHCLAAKYLGKLLIYLDAGSGAKNPVPDNIIAAVKQNVDLPIIVGGGLNSPNMVRRKVEAGAHIVVVGNQFENEGYDHLEDFVNAAHQH